MSPIYEYKCPECKYQFEIIVNKMPQTQQCPNCKNNANRVPTAGMFRFKEHINHPNEPDMVAQASYERKQRKLKLKQEK